MCISAFKWIVYKVVTYYQFRTALDTEAAFSMCNMWALSVFPASLFVASTLLSLLQFEAEGETSSSSTHVAQSCSKLYPEGLAHLACSYELGQGCCWFFSCKSKKFWPVNIKAKQLICRAQFVSSHPNHLPPPTSAWIQLSTLHLHSC